MTRLCPARDCCKGNVPVSVVDRIGRNPKYVGFLDSLIAGSPQGALAYGSRMRSEILPGCVFPPFLDVREQLDSCLRGEVRCWSGTIESGAELWSFAERIGADFIVSSDGSVAQGLLSCGEAGGGALVIRVSDRAVIDEWAWPLGVGECSYGAENGALRCALEGAAATLRCVGTCRVLSVLDGKSSIEHIAKGVPKTQAEAALFRSIGVFSGGPGLDIAHVRAHVGISINERADVLADSGRRMQERARDRPSQISHSGVKAAIQRYVARERERVLLSEQRPGGTVDIFLRARAAGHCKRGDDTQRHQQAVINQLITGRVGAVGLELALDEFLKGETCAHCGAIGVGSGALAIHSAVSRSAVGAFLPAAADNIDWRSVTRGDLVRYAQKVADLRAAKSSHRVIDG